MTKEKNWTINSVGNRIGRVGWTVYGRTRAERCAVWTLVGLGALCAPLGCRQTAPANTPATIIDNNAGPDPAAANMAQAGAYATPGGTVAPGKQSVRVLGAQAQYAPQQSGDSFAQQPANGAQQPPYAGHGGQEVPPPPHGYSQDNAYDSGVNAGYDALEDASQAPPPLPEYDQPPAPEPNTIWTPGYWNYANAGYFWVPGAWVAAPYAGALWTPGYWGVYGNRYRFHRGFWARHVGFYGGVNYGYGYTGTGYEGGYWRGNDFFYNRAVNRVNDTNIRNVYVRNITVNNVTRVSYNGGNGGLQVRPRPEELAVLREQRTPPMTTQMRMREEASGNRQQFFAENHGRPAVPAAARLVPAAGGLQAPPAGAGVPSNLRTQPAQTFERTSAGNPREGNPGTPPVAGQPGGRQATQEQIRTQQDAQARLQQQQRQAQEQAVTLQGGPRNGQTALQQPRGQEPAPPNGNREVQRAPQQPGESQRGGFGQQRGTNGQPDRQPDRQTYQQPRAVQPQSVVPPAASHLQAAPQAVHPQPQPGSQPVAPQRSQQPQAVHPAQVQPQAQPRSQPQPQHTERAQPQPQAAPHATEAKPR